MLQGYRRFKKNTRLRTVIPPTVARTVKRCEVEALRVGRKLSKVSHRTKYDKIYHIGLHKTGSVWFREMLLDLDIYRYSGLPFFDWDLDRRASEYDCGIFCPIRKPCSELLKGFPAENAVAIAVVRHPFSLVLSWIKSTEAYHIAGSKTPGMKKRRLDFQKMRLSEKVEYTVEYFEKDGRFSLIEELIELHEDEDRLLIVRYEDCLAKPHAAFEKILRHLDIDMPEVVRTRFIDRHSREKYLGGSRSPVRHSAIQGVGTEDHWQIDGDERKFLMQACGPKYKSLYDLTES